LYQTSLRGRITPVVGLLEEIHFTVDREEQHPVCL
jgi:hypothetical protein